MQLPVVAIAQSYRDESGKPITEISAKKPFTLYVNATSPPGAPSQAPALARLFKIETPRIPFAARPTVLQDKYDVKSPLEVNLELKPEDYAALLAFEHDIHAKARAVLCKLTPADLVAKTTVQPAKTLKEGRDVAAYVPVRVKGWGNRFTPGKPRVQGDFTFPGDPVWTSVARAAVMPDDASVFLLRLVGEKYTRVSGSRLLCPGDIKPNVTSGSAWLYVSHLWTKFNKEGVLQFGVTYGLQTLYMTNRVAPAMNPDGVEIDDEPEALESLGDVAEAPKEVKEDAFAAASGVKSSPGRKRARMDGTQVAEEGAGAGGQ